MNLDSKDLAPALGYVEFHLTEHCNLDCKGCGHFSPIAQTEYADPLSFARDLTQLSKKFSTIGQIRLMGGEPLLHPTPESFITSAREIFPTSDIRIVTNGLLLKKASERFWEACRQAQVTIDISLYQILEKSAADVLEFCAQQCVSVYKRHITSFLQTINPSGDSDPDRSFAYCRSLFYCPFLYDSHLYVCALPPTVRYYNEKFDRSVPGDAGIDIYDPTLDGPAILQLLETPIETCKFCAVTYTKYEWQRSRKEFHAEDWEVTQ